MVEILKTTTQNPISRMGEVAGICWGSDVSDSDKNYKRGLECLRSGHYRILEYVDVEMVLSDISARLGREWYTHIGGAPTRLQSSTRYIDYNNFDYVTPPKVANNTLANALYSGMMDNISTTLKKLEVECNIPREDIAMLLPLGMKTKIADKRNLRNLIEMSHQRLCTRAYWEYRQLFYDIIKALSEYSDEWKYLVEEEQIFKPKCEVIGLCTEKKSCGRMPRR